MREEEEVGETMQNTGFPLNWFVAGPGNETPEHTWGWRTQLETAVRSGVETEVWALTSGKEFADLKQFVECAKLLHHAVEGGHLAVAQAQPVLDPSGVCVSKIEDAQTACKDHSCAAAARLGTGPCIRVSG